MVISRTAGPATRDGAPSTEFGTVHWASGVVRRRPGLMWARLRHPRAQFGARCDVRRGVRLLVGRHGRAEFGEGCVLDHGFVAECRGALEVGDRTVFGHHCTIAADDRVTIGRDCLIAELVSIRDHDHAFADPDVPVIDQGRKTEPVHIGDNVWLGGKVTVTRGVTIGHNTVVGAHAVVTGDLPSDCVAVGIPARVIAQRQPLTR